MHNMLETAVRKWEILAVVFCKLHDFILIECFIRFNVRLLSTLTLNRVFTNNSNNI